MLLRHLRYTSNFYPYSSLRPISAQFSAVAKHITATVRKDLVSLEFQLSGERPINFFVSPSFTFKTLKDTILTQYPTADFEYNFSATQKSDIEENSNIYDFLNSKANLEAKIHINEDDFVLKSIGGEPLSQTVFSLINETREDKISTISWYGKSLEKGIPQPHAGTLAYFISNFNAELEKYKGKGKLSEKEIEEAVKKAAVFGKEPVERKLETCYHEINILTSQINVLEHEKLTIEDRAEARINKYLKIILFVTLAQFASFYYMIFHVEWLGWDIIEPITYTVQCLTVVFGLRFYMKYGLGRDLGAIKILNRNKMINKDKVVQAKYKLACQQLAYKEKQRKLLMLQRDLYLNRRNYFQFFYSDNADTRQTS